MIAQQEDRNMENILQIEAMNTEFYIQAEGCQRKEWKDIILGWIRYVEKEWSRFSMDNELHRLNELKAGEQMSLSPPLFDVLQKAEEYRRKTNGLFSPYLLPQMEFHGYDRAFPFTIAQSREQGLPSMAANPFKFYVKINTVKRISPGKVDLGGIGKGYAVQSAAQWLKEMGKARSGIIDGGGDITVWSNGEKEWKIGVAHPFENNQEIAQFRLKNASVATSNILYRSWEQGLEKKHHLLNGKTGLPVETSIIQATVICDQLLDAEVAAKLCFMGKSSISKFKKIADIHSMILINKDGEIILDQP